MYNNFIIGPHGLKMISKAGRFAYEDDKVKCKFWVARRRISFVEIFDRLILEKSYPHSRKVIDNFIANA